jgi:uncharacterized membrane protein YfcA
LTEIAVFVIAAIATFGGGLVRGFTGFGAPLIMTPVFAVLYGPVDSVATAAVMDLVSNAKLVPETRRLPQWRDARRIIAGTVIGVPLGLVALLHLDPFVAKQALIAIVGATAIAMMTGWRYRRRLTGPELFATGWGNGFLLGFAYIGPITPITLYAGPDPAATSRLNVIAALVFGNVGTVLAMGVAGTLDPSVGWRALWLAPVLLAGTWAGSRLFGIVDERVFRPWLLAVLIASSVGGLIFVNL